ncbi:unnamed protein product [Linum trigynum]|uniref:Glycosyltransferase 61 catalytic domain-containing protein n=1 Tax=Linum trigynum TaxID=586398 RepID=A0AAV2C964_9ROSI
MGLQQHQHHRSKSQQLLLDDEEMGLVLLITNSKKPSTALTSAPAAATSSAARRKLLTLLFLCLVSFFLILAPHFFPAFYSFDSMADMHSNLSLCSSVANGTICCDRSSIRTDVCYMKGDIRTQSSTSSIRLYAGEYVGEEKIRPYTRKWETTTMSTIDELHLISTSAEQQQSHHCDVTHDVPAVFFSTGGYTGNVYHEFNDGLIPLYITSHQYNKKVVFVILEYHDWWISKYSDILSHLSDYPAVDYSGDKRTHCFPEATVGLRIHDELTIDPALMQGSNRTMVDFRNILDRAYLPRITGLIEDEQREFESESKLPVIPPNSRRPKLVIVSRTGSRAITNEEALVKMAERIGFRVEILRPDPTTELAKIYRAMNSSDVMIGVHGAAMTHFLFMRPGCVFIQVVPLGTDWAAESYYGGPAKRMGLKYIGYKILPKESSLYEKYAVDDPVLRDPESVNQRGWEYTKSIYLDGQNVVLDLKRFQKRLVRAYGSVMRNRNQQRRLQSL